MRSAYSLASLLLFALLGAFCFALHISWGAKSIPLSTVFDAIVNFDNTLFDHIVIRDVRLPRAIFASLAGSALAVAGAMMQGVTRNPMAEPGILGISSGASFAVVLVIGFWGIISPSQIPFVAAVGATITSALVWMIASSASSGATPLILVLSGSVVAAFLSALITIINLMDSDAFQNLRVWLSGSLAGRDPAVLVWTLPWMAIGFVTAFGIARQITALSMGDDIASGLGVNTKRIRSLCLIAIIALTAGAVALAGPLGFIGLVIPHIIRLFGGHDYGVIIPYSAILGAIYLLLIDIGSRVIFAPMEISTGIMTAALGAPFFIWLVRARL